MIGKGLSVRDAAVWLMVGQTALYQALQTNIGKWCNARLSEGAAVPG
jgi:hypothetical protein